MKKLIGFIILIVSVLIFSVFAYAKVSSIDYTTIYKDLLKNIDIEPSDQNLKQIKFKKFPIPCLVASVLQEDGKIYIENLQINFSLLSFLKFKPKVISVRANNVKYYVNCSDYKFNIVDHNKIIENILKNKIPTIDMSINNFTLIDNNQKTTLKFKDLNIINGGNFKGNINDLSFQGNIQLDTENKKRFTINVDSSKYNLNLKESYSDDSFVDGKGSIKLKNLQYFINYIFPEIYNITPNIFIAEGVDINYDIKRDNDIMSFENININTGSKNIEGSGEIKLTNNENLVNEIALHFTKINLDNSYFDSKDKKFYFNPTSLNFNNKRADIKIEIDQAVIIKEGLKNIEFNGSIENNQLNIKKFSGIFDSGGDYLFNGDLSQENYHNVLKGKITLNYNNLNKFLSIFGIKDPGYVTNNPFTYSSDIKLSSVDVFLNNILLKSLDCQIKGKVAAQFIGSLPRINSQLDISFIEVNQDQNPLIASTIDFVKDLLTDMQKKEYLNKFIPIRTISSLSNFDLTFNNIKLIDQKFDKINLLFSLAPGTINVQTFYINKGPNYLDTAIKLDASGIKPKITLKINDGNVPVEFLTVQSLIDFRKTMLEKYDLSKVNIETSGALNAIYQNDTIIKNITFKGTHDKNLLLIDNLSGNCFGGTITLEGSLLLDTYNFNFVYALNDMQLTLLSQIISKSLYNGEKGAFSANGTLITHGETIDKLIYNLYIKSNFMARDIKLVNVSIDDFIKQVTVEKYDVGALEQDLKKMLLTGETTLSKLEGNIEISKGNIEIKNADFKTDYSSGAITGYLNIYNFNVNLNAQLSFLHKNLNNNNSNYTYDYKTNSYTNYDDSKINIPVKIEGNYFQPSKTCDSKEITTKLTPPPPPKPTPPPMQPVQPLP